MVRVLTRDGKSAYKSWLMLARSATCGSSAFATNNVLVASDTSFYVDLLFGTNFGNAQSTNVTATCNMVSI